jgi:hypothetical protein
MKIKTYCFNYYCHFSLDVRLAVSIGDIENYKNNRFVYSKCIIIYKYIWKMQLKSYNNEVSGSDFL